MKIKVLGAHNCESSATRLVSLLIDDVLALDAGSLTSSLTFVAQQKLKAILLTHQHYDHIRDVPALAMNALFYETNISVYATQIVRDALETHWLNGVTYSQFLEKPEGNPIINFTTVEPYKALQIGEYRVLPLPVSHSVPTTGYQITGPDGKKLLYTGDTGPGLSDCWEHASPDLIITEVTAPDRYLEFSRKNRHLTPVLLKEELISFRKQKGYLPPVIAVHMNPRQENEIATEITLVAAELKTSISLAYEGMLIQL